MHRARRLILFIALVGLWAAPARAQQPGAPLEGLRSPEAEVRMAAVADCAAAGPEAIAPLFDLMGTADQTTDLAARMAVERMVHHAAGPPGAGNRAAVARELARQATCARPAAVRVFAVRMLSFVGGEEAVPTLAGLLCDPALGEIARWALERIPGPAAGQALLEALPAAQGDLKVGIIHALAARRAWSAWPQLAEATNDPDPGVRWAALAAIGRLPGLRSEELLRARIHAGPGADLPAAWDAYVRLAEEALASRRSALAVHAYQWAYEHAPSEQLRCAGLIGLGQAGGAQAVPALLAALGARERNLRGAAIEGLVAAPGPQATHQIAAAMNASGPRRKALLAHLLGERGDPAAQGALIKASTGADPQVRVEACWALGRVGDAGAVEALAARLADASEPVREAALAALARIPGRDATQFIVRALPGREDEARASLVLALAYRKDAPALEAVVAALRDNWRVVRLAAAQGLGATAGMTTLAARRALAGMLVEGDEDERQAAEAALACVPPAKITDAERAGVARYAPSLPAPARAALLRVAALWGDPQLAQVFLEATADARDEQVALAGYQGLAGLLSQGLEQALEERIEGKLRSAVEHDSGARKSAALSAYLALADRRRGEADPRALEIYHRAVVAADDDHSRAQALRGIAAIGSVESLPLVEPLLSHPGAGQEAAAAVMPIADKLAEAGERERAADLYARAVRASSDRDLLRRAVERLNALGVEMDIAAEAGFVTRWWVLGPFPGRREMAQRDVIATDRRIDPAAPAVVGDATFTWKPVHIADPMGMLDLREAVARRDNHAAYAYTEVTSDQDRDALLKIGSDDAITVWLNGVHVHTYPDDRGWSPDQDTVPVKLRAGMNFILIKVINGGGDWAASVRVTDPAGRPLRLEQRGPRGILSF